MTTANAARVLGHVPNNPPDYDRAEEGCLWLEPTLESVAGGRDWADLKSRERLAILSQFAVVPHTPDHFEDLRFAHHRGTDGAVVWKGVAAAMAALLAEYKDLEPETAREAYDHLAAHFVEFGKTPPTMPTPLKAAPSSADRKLYAPCLFSLKSLDTRARTFSGLAATWDLDLGGDVIHRGAFRETIEDWRKGSKALPLLDSHNYFSILSAVGKLTDAKETKAGLQTDWKVIPGPDGDRVLDRLEAGVVDSMSIGYVAKAFDFSESEKEEGPFDLIRNLRKVELREVSLVLFPMQPNALIDLGAAKAAVAGRGLDADERSRLASIHDELGRLLSAEPAGPPSGAKSQPAEDTFNRLARLRVQRLRLTQQRS